MFMTTDFTKIIFNPQYHTYTLDGQKLTSVTKVVGQLKPPFDADTIATKQAAKLGTTKEAVLAEWDAKRQAGLERGNRVHEHIRSTLLGLTVQPDRFLDMNTKPVECLAFDRFWEQIKSTVDVKWVETVIGDYNLGIAGTVDAVLVDKQTGACRLWDWKTGDKFRLDNRFQTLNPPFADCDDCELVNYSLQASLYRLIIERNTSLEFSATYILHLSPSNGFNVYNAIDYRQRLVEWLELG